MTVLDERTTQRKGADAHTRRRQTLAKCDGLVEIVDVTPELMRQSELRSFLDGCGLVPGLWAEIVCQTSVGTHVVGARAIAVVPTSLAEQVTVRAIDPMAD